MNREPSRVLAFFAHERTDARVIKRIRALQELGWHVVGFTFHRPRPGRDDEPSWENIPLGETRDRAYVHRAISLVRAFGILWRQRRRLAAAQCLYAINFDNGILALAARCFARCKVPLALEIADIQPPFVSRSLRGKFLRWLERRVLARSSLLITTSPGFVENYFAPLQHFRGPVFFLENKVYPSRALIAARDAADRDPASGRPAPLWRLGWFGAFRCQRSWDLIKALAHEFPDTLRIVLRGYPSVLDSARFADEVKQFPNIEFRGAYRSPDDLPALYGDIHFNWCFDFHHATANSKWLLPNRIYEGGLFRVPALAARGTQTGSWVEEKQAGWVFGDDVESELKAFLRAVTFDEWRAVRARCAQHPDDEFAGEADYARLSDRLLSGAGAGPDAASPRTR